MFSLQLEASPICHLALEKRITDLNKGDLFEICFIIFYFHSVTCYSSVNEFIIFDYNEKVTFEIYFDNNDNNHLHLLCYS